MHHTMAWGMWLLAALMPFLLTKNPFYLTLAIFVISVNYALVRRTSPTSQSWGLLLRLGLAFAAISILFNALWVRVGTTPLVTIPTWSFALGQTVFQLSGVITLESVTYALVQAMAMLGILIALAVFNTCVDHYALLRSAPRFMHQSAIVLSIAVTFVPQMLLAQAEIREAQLLRGHRFRARRDLPRLFVTLLAEGLERSITLAESMSARGFGGQSVYTRRATMLLQTLIALALFVLLVGAVALNYFAEKIVGALLLAVGSGILLAVLWRISESVRASRYRRERWQRRDTILAGAALLVLAIFFGVALLDRASLYFYPYPRLTLPPFQPILALTILLLGIPAVTSRGNQGVDE